jgi:DNA-binding transcriptional ArsR family regulator
MKAGAQAPTLVSTLNPPFSAGGGDTLGRLDAGAAHESAEQARALPDPTRLTLASALGEGGELCGCNLAWISERAQNLVSHYSSRLAGNEEASSPADGRVRSSSTPSPRVGLVALGRADVARPSLCGSRSRIRVQPDRSDPRPHPRTRLSGRFVTGSSGNRVGDQADPTRRTRRASRPGPEDHGGG